MSPLTRLRSIRQIKAACRTIHPPLFAGFAGKPCFQDCPRCHRAGAFFRELEQSGAGRVESLTRLSRGRVPSAPAASLPHPLCRGAFSLGPGATGLHVDAEGNDTLPCRPRPSSGLPAAALASQLGATLTVDAPDYLPPSPGRAIQAPRSSPSPRGFFRVSSFRLPPLPLCRIMVHAVVLFPRRWMHWRRRDRRRLSEVVVDRAGVE